MSAPSIAPSIFDLNSLTALKRRTKENDPAALTAAAQQFEAMFLQMVLKSMRDALPQGGLFDSDQSRLYQSLLDQQMGQVLATQGRGTGLAAMIEKQLSRTTVTEAEEFPDGLPLEGTGVAWPLVAARAASATRKAVSAYAASGTAANLSPSASEFLQQVWPHAVEASRSTGIPAEFMVAQAALETGWGKSMPRRADGQPSYNLFGIKAGSSWTGATVAANTTEYQDGVAQQQVERFRAYGSYAESFQDYARLMNNNPRYAGVLAATDARSFAQAMQRAGYATDPEYADKIERIIAGATMKAASAS